MDDVCRIAGCYGPNTKGTSALCDRHAYDATLPAMPVECECGVPDVEDLRMYGAGAAFCRQCGSPMPGTVSSR